MFDDTLTSSWDERSRRGVTTLTSFGLQVLVVGVLLIVPLLRPAGVPLLHQLSMPVSLGQPLGEPPAPRTHAGANTAPRTDSVDLILRSPRRIPSQILPSDDGPAQAPSLGPSIGTGPVGDPRGIPNMPTSSVQPVLPVVAPLPRTAPVRISHISEGNLIRKVLPTYPTLARSARIQGSVVLQAVISREGAIENLRVVSGHPMLVPAAIDAVRQWQYRPYVLNNEPVEVETQVTVNFSLAGN